MKSGTTAILFSLEVKPTGALDPSRVPNEHLRGAVTARQRNGGRVMVCVGGAGRSAAFPLVASDSFLRKRFARQLSHFCKKHGLDGADLDWEAPSNVRENEHYGLLLAEVKASFKQSGLLLSVAIHAWQDLGRLAFSSVDRVHLMAYDAQEPHNRHATFDTMKRYVGHVAHFGGLQGQANQELLQKIAV